MLTPYKAGSKDGDNLQENGDVWWGVTGPEGPYCGLGYYSHTLCPHLSMETKAEADRAAQIANIAYNVGYLQAKKELRDFLGVKG